MVDDQWVVQDLVRTILTGQGHAVRQACTAQDALRQAREADLDLVILDAHLPGGNGWELLPIFRAEFPARPVIMLTGDAPAEQWRRLFAHDPSAPFEILEKPFQVWLFEETVSRALEERDRLSA